VSISNKLTEVNDQMRFDRKHLVEIEREHTEVHDRLTDYVELGHWQAAADMCNRLWSLEGFQKRIEARIEINTKWLATIKPGQPVTDHDG
jgi:hypothetical protein